MLVAKAMGLTSAERQTVALKVRIHSFQDTGCPTFSAVRNGQVVESGEDEALIHALAGIRDLVGVAFDTVRQFCGGNSNDEQVMKITVAAATKIATRTGAFVVLAHHTGKQNFRGKVIDMYVSVSTVA